MINFNIMGIHWKILFLTSGHKESIYRGELPKKRGLAVWKFKTGVGEKEEG